MKEGCCGFCDSRSTHDRLRRPGHCRSGTWKTNPSFLSFLCTKYPALVRVNNSAIHFAKLALALRGVSLDHEYHDATAVWVETADGMKYVGIIGKLASHLRIRKCPHCHSYAVRRSHRKNLVESALSFWGIYPFRCENCNARFRKLYGRRLV
jgi:hypothetical protein